MKSYLAMVAVAAFLLPGTPRPAQAQSTDSEEESAACSLCSHNLTDNRHWFSSPKEACTGNNPCMDCRTPTQEGGYNICHTNPQAPFACSYYHNDCPSEFASRNVVEKALQGRNPAAGIVIAVNTMPDKLRLSSAGYVLVRGCHGGVVAAYKVPLGARLPQSPGVQVSWLEPPLPNGGHGGAGLLLAKRVG